MPNIKSAKKRVKISKRNNLRSTSSKSAMRTALRSAKETIKNSGLQAAQDLINKAFSLVDKAVKRGIIHKNAAARFKSRLLSA